MEGTIRSTYCLTFISKHPHVPAWERGAVFEVSGAAIRKASFSSAACAERSRSKRSRSQKRGFSRGFN